MFTEYVIALIIMVSPHEGTMMLARDLEYLDRSMVFQDKDSCETYRTKELPHRQGWMKRLPEAATTKTVCMPVKTQAY